MPSLHNILLVLLHLGGGAVASVATWPVRRGSQGEKFVATFSKEGLFPLTARARGALAGVSRCLGCMRCECHAAGNSARGGSVAASPAALLADLRALQDVRLLQGRIRELKGADLDAMEQGCPVGVPFRAAVEQAEEILAALAAGRT